MNASLNYPCTYDILLDRVDRVDRVERGTDCRRCVDWAIGLLFQGCDSDFVCRLAGQTPPFDLDTVSYLRDRALREIGFDDLDAETLICQMVAHLLSQAIDDNTRLQEALRFARGLYVAYQYDTLRTLYLLSHALQEFAEYDEQWYIPDMDGKNLESRTHEIVQEFMRQHPCPI